MDRYTKKDQYNYKVDLCKIKRIPLLLELDDLKYFKIEDIPNCGMDFEEDEYELQVSLPFSDILYMSIPLILKAEGAHCISTNEKKTIAFVFTPKGDWDKEYNRVKEFAGLKKRE